LQQVHDQSDAVASNNTKESPSSPIHGDVRRLSEILALASKGDTQLCNTQHIGFSVADFAEAFKSAPEPPMFQTRAAEIVGSSDQKLGDPAQNQNDVQKKHMEFVRQHMLSQQMMSKRKHADISPDLLTQQLWVINSMPPVPAAMQAAFLGQGTTDMPPPLDDASDSEDEEPNRLVQTKGFLHTVNQSVVNPAALYQGTPIPRMDPAVVAAVMASLSENPSVLSGPDSVRELWSMSALPDGNQISHPNRQVKGTTSEMKVIGSTAADIPTKPKRVHITIWNKVEKRKLSGNAAPLEQNLEGYLRTHSDWELYTNQDAKTPNRSAPRQPRTQKPQVTAPKVEPVVQPEVQPVDHSAIAIKNEDAAVDSAPAPQLRGPELNVKVEQVAENHKRQRLAEMTNDYTNHGDTFAGAYSEDTHGAATSDLVFNLQRLMAFSRQNCTAGGSLMQHVQDMLWQNVPGQNVPVQNDPLEMIDVDTLLGSDMELPLDLYPYAHM